MKQLKVLIYLVISLMIMSVCFGMFESLESKIYNTFFKRIDHAAIFNMVTNKEGSKYIPSIIKDKEVLLIRESMKEIKSIKQINTKQFGFNSYHQLYLYFKNPKAQLIALYSLKEKSFLIKEHDIDKSKIIDDQLYYSILKFEIPAEVLKILENHEKELPKEGEYFDSWPLGY